MLVGTKVLKLARCGLQQRPLSTAVEPLVAGQRIPPGTRIGGRTTVTLIPGDGIGAEMATAVKAIFKAAEVPVDFEEFPLSGFKKADEVLAKQAMASLRNNKVGLKGILFTPVDRMGHKSFNVFLRKDLDVFASISHVINMPGVTNIRQSNVDFVIIRENTEGEYSGLEHQPTPGVVESLKIVTRQKTERIAKFAFDFAVKNKRKKVTCVHKANIMKLADGLFLNTCAEVAKRYEPFGIKFESMIVDNTAMQMVSKPSQFDVVVCGNLYGNIISNIGAGLVGGAGLIPGANYGREYAIFEPGCRHVAKDIEGKNLANPTSMILSSVWMLRHLDYNVEAERINKALLGSLSQKEFCTRDILGTSSTTDFVQAIIRNLE